MSLVSVYKKAWQNNLANWKTLALVFFINLAFAYLLITPITNWLKQELSDSLLQDKLSGPFDYTLFTELLRNNSLGLEIFISQFLILLILYFLWAVFYTGGFMGLIVFGQGHFWKSGARFFWRFLRLAIYVIIAWLIFILIAILFLGLLNFNPLEMENEMGLIRKLWIIAIVGMGVGFFIGLFRDLAKIEILDSNNKLITQDAIRAIKASFGSENITMALLNIFFLFVFVIGYYFLNKWFGSYWLAAFILSQLLIIVRICYRFTRMASLQYLHEKSA